MLFRHTNGAAKQGDPATQQDLGHLKVTDVRPGDTVSVPGVGDGFEDLDFTLDRRFTVEAGQQKWTEASGPYRNRRVYLEIHNEDEVEVFGNFDDRTFTLDQLGLSEDDLAQIDQRQNPADNFDFEEKTWMYRWSRELGIFREGDTQGTGCYCWRFQEDGGTRVLTVRKFEGQPFQGWIGQKVPPEDVTVYRA